MATRLRSRTDVLDCGYPSEAEISETHASRCTRSKNSRICSARPADFTTEGGMTASILDAGRNAVSSAENVADASILADPLVFRLVGACGPASYVPLRQAVAKKPTRQNVSGKEKKGLARSGLN